MKLSSYNFPISGNAEESLFFNTKSGKYAFIAKEVYARLQANAPVPGDATAVELLTKKGLLLPDGTDELAVFCGELEKRVLQENQIDLIAFLEQAESGEQTANAVFAYLNRTAGDTIKLRVCGSAPLPEKKRLAERISGVYQDRSFLSMLMLSDCRELSEVRPPLLDPFHAVYIPLEMDSPFTGSFLSLRLLLQKAFAVACSNKAVLIQLFLKKAAQASAYEPFLENLVKCRDLLNHPAIRLEILHKETELLLPHHPAVCRGFFEREQQTIYTIQQKLFEKGIVVLQGFQLVLFNPGCLYTSRSGVLIGSDQAICTCYHKQHKNAVKKSFMPFTQNIPQECAACALLPLCLGECPVQKAPPAPEHCSKRKAHYSINLQLLYYANREQERK